MRWRHLAWYAWSACALAQEAPLKVCVLSHNLPYSAQASATGFDVETARAVALALHRELALVWVANPTSIQEIDDSDFPLPRLAHGGCDAIFSLPGPARDTLKGQSSLALGAPYYGAAFELFGAPTTPGNLRALRDQPVAIQAQTVASFALAILHAKQRTFFAPLPALQSVAEGDAAAALLWGPSAGWQLKQHAELKLAIASGYAPPPALSWNLQVATRTTDAALRAAIDAALQKLTRDGRLAQLAVEYGIPFHPPFAATYSLTEINKLQ